MSEELKLAFSLLVLGMVTVFSMLFLVYAGGRILIAWANRYYPEAATVPDRIREERPIGQSTSHKNKIAAIMAVVDIVTRGRGRIASIRKLNQ